MGSLVIAAILGLAAIQEKVDLVASAVTAVLVYLDTLVTLALVFLVILVFQGFLEQMAHLAIADFLALAVILEVEYQVIVAIVVAV